MQFQPWDNPMGTDGFEFVEYAAPDPKALGKRGAPSHMASGRGMNCTATAEAIASPTASPNWKRRATPAPEMR